MDGLGWGPSDHRHGASGTRRAAWDLRGGGTSGGQGEGFGGLGAGGDSSPVSRETAVRESIQASDGLLDCHAAARDGGPPSRKHGLGICPPGTWHSGSAGALLGCPALGQAPGLAPGRSESGARVRGGSPLQVPFGMCPGLPLVRRGWGDKPFGLAGRWPDHLLAVHRRSGTRSEWLRWRALVGVVMVPARPGAQERARGTRGSHADLRPTDGSHASRGRPAEVGMPGDAKAGEACRRLSRIVRDAEGSVTSGVSCLRQREAVRCIRDRDPGAAHGARTPDRALPSACHDGESLAAGCLMQGMYRRGTPPGTGPLARGAGTGSGCGDLRPRDAGWRISFLSGQVPDAEATSLLPRRHLGWRPRLVGSRDRRVGLPGGPDR